MMGNDVTGIKSGEVLIKIKPRGTTEGNEFWMAQEHGFIDANIELVNLFDGQSKCFGFDELLNGFEKVWDGEYEEALNSLLYHNLKLRDQIQMVFNAAMDYNVLVEKRKDRIKLPEAVAGVQAEAPRGGANETSDLGAMTNTPTK